MCNQSSENIEDIFKSCPFTQGIWNRIKYNCHTPIFFKSNFLSLLGIVYKHYKSNVKSSKTPYESSCF